MTSTITQKFLLKYNSWLLARQQGKYELTLSSVNKSQFDILYQKETKNFLNSILDAKIFLYFLTGGGALSAPLLTLVLFGLQKIQRQFWKALKKSAWVF